jgi:hypothetical protein
MSNLIGAVAQAQTADRLRAAESRRRGIALPGRAQGGLISRLRRRYSSHGHARQLGTLHRA